MLLVGIVGLNVFALSLSSSSSAAARQSDELKRENSALRAQIASLLSSQEIQTAATELGLAFASPGAIRYVRPGADDAALAAERLRAGELDRSRVRGAGRQLPPVPVAPRSSDRGRAGRGGAGRHPRPRPWPTRRPSQRRPWPMPAARRRRAPRREPDRPPRRPPVRGVRRPSRSRPRPRGLGPGDRRRLALRSGAEPADRERGRPRVARHDLRPQRAASSPSPRTRRPCSRPRTRSRTRTRPRTSSPLSSTTPEHEILASLADRDSGFAYLDRKVDLADRGEDRASSTSPGIGMLPDSRRIYPQGELAGQVIGTVGIDNQGLTGLEASEDEALHGTDGEREVVRDALGDELERSTTAAAQTGADLSLTIDASLQAETERVLAGIGETYQPDGATRDRHGPAQLRDPGDGELARASTRRTRPTPSPTRCATSPPASPTSPARPSRRSRSPARSRTASSPRRRPSTSADPPGRRPGDRGVARAGLRHPLGRRHPRAVVERRRGQGRDGAQRRVRRSLLRRALRPLGRRASASASPPGSTSRARSRGSSSRPTSTRARRWATCRSARASR